MCGPLQKEEQPIDERIASELVDLTPEWWRSAELVVAYTAENGVERYSHVISSPEGHKEPIVPSEALQAATYELGRLFQRHGKHWKVVRYGVYMLGGGSWKYEVDFEY